MSPADTTLIINNHPLRIRLGATRSRVYFDIRYFYQPEDGRNLQPEKRGITLPVNHLDSVINALNKIKDQMIHDGALEYTGQDNPPKLHLHVYPADF